MTRTGRESHERDLKSVFSAAGPAAALAVVIIRGSGGAATAARPGMIVVVVIVDFGSRAGAALRTRVVVIIRAIVVVRAARRPPGRRWAPVVAAPRTGVVSVIRIRAAIPSIVIVRKRAPVDIIGTGVRVAAISAVIRVAATPAAAVVPAGVIPAAGNRRRALRVVVPGVRIVFPGAPVVAGRGGKSTAGAARRGV
jgi:hypothetical protein